MNNGTVWLLSWDILGLESVVSVSSIEKEAAWDVLRGAPTSKINHIVSSILMRARANEQRHYEVYTVTMDDGITEEYIRQMFNDAPQGMADLIRENGNKIYSGRLNQKEIKII